MGPIRKIPGLSSDGSHATLVAMRRHPSEIILKKPPSKAMGVSFDKHTATCLEKLHWASQLPKTDIVRRVMKKFFELPVDQQLEVIDGD